MPPVNNFYGFWLRTLEPPGHAHCRTKILSNTPTHEVSHVFECDYKREVAGVVHFEPLNSCARSGNSKIRWIKFGFDDDFNPVLWLANDKHSDRLRSVFEQAALSGSNSQMHKEIMGVDGIAEGKYKEYRQRDTLDWRNLLSKEGAFFMTVDKKKGLLGHKISSLKLKISVELQHHHSQTLASALDIDASRPSLDAMGIWVVDITDAGGGLSRRKGI